MITAYCPYCRKKFPSFYNAFVAGSSMFSVDRSAESCPTCGKMAYVESAVGQRISPHSPGQPPTYRVSNRFSDPQAAYALLEIDKKLRRGAITEQKAKKEAEKVAAGSSSLFTERGLSKSTRAMIYATIAGPVIATGIQFAASYALSSRSTQEGNSAPRIEVIINGDNNIVNIGVGELTASTRTPPEIMNIEATAAPPRINRPVEHVDLDFGDDVPSMTSVDWYFFLYDRFGIIARRFSLPPVQQ